MTTLRDFLAAPITIDDQYYADLENFVNWAARNYAENTDYFSDSTIDSHNAMIALMTSLHDLRYGYNQTKDDETALDAFLDAPYNHADLYMSIFHNCSERLPAPTFVTKHFPTLLDDDIDEKYDDFWN